MKLMRIDKIKRLAAYLLLPVLAGCATSRLLADKTLLEFLEDGKTSKHMVILKLGQPSGTFDGEKIVTYRIGAEEKEEGYFVLNLQGGPPVPGRWTGAKFSLVLIFDEHNVLQKHSLVPVQ